MIIRMGAVSRVGAGGENSEVREQKAGRQGGRAEGRRNHRQKGEGSQGGKEESAEYASEEG